MLAVVSDTTVLIVLGAQQRLDLLGACFDRILVPEAVYRARQSGVCLPDISRLTAARPPRTWRRSGR